MLEQTWTIEYVEWSETNAVYRVVRSVNLGAYKLE